MGTITEKLDKLATTKDAIRQAIMDKGVELPIAEPFSGYPAKIAEIQNGGGDGELFADVYNQKKVIVEIGDQYSNGLSKLIDGSFFFLNNNLLSQFDAALTNLKTGASMFSGCVNLMSSRFEMPNLEKGDSMFLNCLKLNISGQVDLPALKSASTMFRSSGVTSFAGSFPNLTDGSHMFYQSQLRNFSGNLPKITNAQYMLASPSLRACEVEMPNVSNIRSLFYGCQSLTTVNANFTNAEDADSAFDKCYSLENIQLVGTVNCALSFVGSSRLTLESALNILNALTDRTGQEPLTIALSVTTAALLTDEQKAIATNKNWNLA